MGKISFLVKKILIFFLNCYRYLISPILGPHCRFYPTCSEYAIIAVERFGALKGVVLAVKRISRCHPFKEGGFDPVPETKDD